MVKKKINKDKQAAPTPRKTTARRPLRSKPETLRLRTVSPALTVTDINTSVKWYRDVMGFIVVDEWTHEDRLAGATVRAGTIEFVLVRDEFAQGGDRPKGGGFRLYCQTHQDLDQLAADITARGGTLAREPTDQPWGVREFAVIDPDGFKISIVSLGEA